MKVHSSMKIFPKWESLIRRAKLEIDDTIGNNRSDGIALVTMHVAFTAQGEPIVWTMSGKRVEPSGSAKEVIASLARAGFID